jgi:hypothetical protein
MGWDGMGCALGTTISSLPLTLDGGEVGSRSQRLRFAGLRLRVALLCYLPTHQTSASELFPGGREGHASSIQYSTMGGCNKTSAVRYRGTFDLLP